MDLDLSLFVALPGYGCVFCHAINPCYWLMVRLPGFPSPPEVQEYVLPQVFVVLAAVSTKGAAYLVDKRCVACHCGEEWVLVGLHFLRDGFRQY